MGDRIANGKAELELASFPLVWLSERGVLSDSERVQVIEALDELLDRRGRHALVLDLRRGRPLPEEQRVYLADHWSIRADDIAEKWACLSVVLSQPVLEHLPIAAFWQRVSPVPSRVFTAFEDAMAWAQVCLQQTRTGEIAVSGKATVRSIRR